MIDLTLLSGREREIAERLADADDPRKIAEQLVISLATVRTHIFNAYQKLGLSGRADGKDPRILLAHKVWEERVNRRIKENK